MSTGSKRFGTGSERRPGRLTLGLLAGLLSAMTSLAWGADAGSLAAGRALSQSCAMCHGAKGDIDSDTIPPLAGQSRQYLIEQLKAYRSGKRENYCLPTMTVLGKRLSDQQIADLATYYASQKRVMHPVHGSGSVVGHHLYHFGRANDRIGACEYCHGIHGQGFHDQGKGFPTLRGLPAAYVRATLQEFRNGDRRGGHTRIMHHISSRLSDSDIANVARYIATLR